MKFKIQFCGSARATNLFAEDKEMKDIGNEVPFFARYLEGQDFPNVKTSIKAGITIRFPSDFDGPGDVTHKYPSDGDEEPPDVR